MDGDTGITLFEPSDIKLNIVGTEEDDEEALEDQKRRDQVLKAQLEKAFDDWSDDEDTTIDKDRIPNICSSPKSSTDDDDDVDTTIDKDRAQNNSNIPKMSTRGITFHNLSNISERSMNKSGGQSSENSGVFTSGTELSPSASEFTGLMGGRGDFQNGNEPIYKNIPYNQSDKFEPIFVKSPLTTQSTNGGEDPYRQAAMDGRGDFEKQNQPIFKNRPYNKSDEKFVPIFVKPPPIRQSSNGNADAYRQAAMVGRGDIEKQSQPILKNNSHDQSNDKFEPFFAKTQTTEHSLDGSEDAYRQSELSSESQLEVLYQVRLKEIQRLTSQLESERKDATAYKQQTLMQMALLQSDKERALLSRTEADKLLVASKDEISNLKKEVATLKQTLESVEKDKKQSDELVELSRVQIQELEDRMTLMERCDSSMRLAKQTNLMVKNLKSKHQEEVGLLQDQLETVTKKLLEKEEESRDLEQRLEQMSVGKAATISQLTHSLEDSQRQCQQLLETNVVAENVGLHHQLNQVLLDRDQLAQTVNSLREECKLLKSELDTVSPTDSMVQMGMISRSQSRSADSSTNLQAELHRALLNQKAKRAEVERLQEIVSDKEKEIQEIKRQQQIASAENEALSVELSQVKEELRNASERIQESSVSNYEVPQLHKGKIKNQDRELQQKLEDMAVCANSEMKKEADLKLKEVSVRLEQSLKEVKELKDTYLGVTTELAVAKGHMQQAIEERDSLNKQLRACLDQANLLHREKSELASEIKKLKNQLMNNLQDNKEEQLREESARLQHELSAMSARHAQELSSARSELQATRDRVSQLEKNTRLQFETKIKALHQERDTLKTKCDEKEVQIKKLIESRKRVPSVVSVATETDEEVNWEERLERERARYRQEYDATLAVMEKVHQDVMAATQQKHIEDKEYLRQSHLRALNELEQQLVTIEEHTKEKTIHFFSEKIHELETKYQEELKCASDPSEVLRLKTEVADQARQIEILSESLERANDTVRMRMKELAVEREAERRRAALLMEQWSQEMKFVQEELKLKEDSMKQLKFKLESAKYCAKTNHDKLVKTNKELTETVNSKLVGYRAKLKANIENYEKDVWGKVEKIESVYRRRERRLHQEFKKQLMTEL